LATRSPQGPVGIEVKTLIVGAQPRTQIALGDPTSFTLAITRLAERVRGIVWNEDRIHLILDGSGMEVRFDPEMLPSAGMFFRRKPKSRYDRDDDDQGGPVAWEGDYEPVIFTKRNFVRFLKENVTTFDPQVADAVKELKVSQVMTVREELMDDETDNVRSVSEDAQFTNVPRRFTMTMPLAEGWSAELALETEPCRVDGGRGKLGIKVVCANARKIRRDLMEHVLASVSKDIPRYYGAMKISDGK